ncbi:potassium channel subfamily K member 16-like isoform X2 [Chiroxiphia lanceolata]|uniref:potassium channel subfamily K member 16-like isoform X2 n=1 Tax=Chiroxiphia lanceolata TaxID=296741 RepID=UPI0013CF0AE0|nr:potassium channel subfamily K member 16-like isoform X2 [Chiroxiphia lanceolata]
MQPTERKVFSWVRYVLVFFFTQLPNECIWQLTVPVSTGSQRKPELGGLFLPRGRLPRSVRDLLIATFHSLVPLCVPLKAMCSGKLQTGLLVAGYFVYLLVGAAVFQALERTAEKQEKMAAAQMKEAFLQSFRQLTVVEMEQFMKNLTEAIQNGVYPVGNESRFEESNWDFSNSFFFAGTVVSTIGYGTLHPRTVGGQIFCVFFALFGIPLNIVFLHRVGKMLSLLCKKLGKFLYEKGMRKANSLAGITFPTIECWWPFGFFSALPGLLCCLIY